jgi:hypothetical protein
MSQPESDTEWQRKHGLGYGRLAAASVRRFETDDDRRRNLEDTVRVLSEENARALTELADLKALIAKIPLDVLDRVNIPPAPETLSVGQTTTLRPWENT